MTAEEMLLARKSSLKFKAICMECGKKFSTKSALPTCPKCKGSDIEVA